MAGILIGTLAGMAIGLGIGAMIAVTTRDGIWPNLWVILIVVSGLAGAFFGALNWMFG